MAKPTDPKSVAVAEKPLETEVSFHASRGEKAAVVCGTSSAVYTGPVTITVTKE